MSKERPDLEQVKKTLTRQQNEFKIILKQLEDNLLARLSSAGGNFLGDVELVENLETTKRTAADIAVKSEEAKVSLNYSTLISLLAWPRGLTHYFCLVG